MYRIPHSALFLWSLALIPVLADADFYFQWPSSTSQCQAVPISWSMGQPPFKVWIIPVYGQPFFYDISDSYYSNRTGNTEILLQLAAGVNYVVQMGDANGISTGGSSEVQTVQAANDSTCLSTASSYSASLDFTFTVSGQAVQCERGFELSWTGGLEYGPYNFTAVAMDQSFNAFDVPLEKGVTSESDWVLDIPADSRFVVMMNSAQGYGRGGTSGIYSVSSGNDSSCLDMAPQPTGSWPNSITTGSLDPPTLPVTQSAHSGAGHSGISGGGIAGVVIGVVAALALILVILFFLLRRRRNRIQGQRTGKIENSHIDLVNDNESRSGQPMVEPYRELGSFHPPEGHSTTSDSNTYLGSTSTSRESQAGFANLGAPTSGGLSNSHSISNSHAHSHSESRTPEYGDNRNSLLSEEDNGSWVPGIAGPLPTKSNPSSPGPLSSQSPSHSFNRPTTSHSNDSSKPFPSYIDRSPGPGQGQGQGHGQTSAMRVVNPENPESIPALPPGATHERANPPRRRAEGPTYRRHADAGRFQEEIVDLPPLYTEVPRDGPVRNVEE
ncbi:uncharacterized protein IL334_002712 [Kwoniella shivajii]|uniref:Uncharacterized protein n=1 Tax=Kwoniella shivajii TaxID=564305 RepID=A0ABZ1CVJ2_9TREE|nr:hypothetical protein IL334_002712 [Kwoniella shivajii]